MVTLWYRPPELLLGARTYGPPIDLWGAGCIMAELWTKSPIFQGNTEQSQLSLICHLCGSITPDVWPGVDSLELYTRMEFPKGMSRKLKERLRSTIGCEYGLDLLDKLLILDPKKRLDSDSALNHDFFWTDPMPQDLANLLSQYTNSMFEFTTSRRRPMGHPGRHGGQHIFHPNHRGPGRIGNQNSSGQYIDRVF